MSTTTTTKKAATRTRVPSKAEATATAATAKAKADAKAKAAKAAETAKAAVLATATSAARDYIEAYQSAVGDVASRYGTAAVVAWVRAKAAGVTSREFAEAVKVPRGTLEPIFRMTRSLIPAKEREASKNGRVLTPTEARVAKAGALSAKAEASMLKAEADWQAGKRQARKASGARNAGGVSKSVVKVTDWTSATTVLGLLSKAVDDLPHGGEGRDVFASTLASFAKRIAAAKS